ncbi:MAG: DUF3015 family protein [Burkholderiales bacterium]|nr:DUF3015 family protein [Burkholderiales bacterium]
MIQFKSTVLGAIVALSTVVAQAQTTEQPAAPAAAPAQEAAAKPTDKTPGSGPNPFTDCGIGAALFPNTHWAALTSNVVWDLGITALTSATASPQTCQGKKVVAAVFIRDTYEQLAEQTAQGSGEHLATVLNIMGCQAANQQAAALSTREAMSSVIAAPGYAELPRLEKAAQFYGAVDAAVAHNCTL